MQIPVIARNPVDTTEIQWLWRHRATFRLQTSCDKSLYVFTSKFDAVNIVVFELKMFWNLHIYV